MIDLKSPLKNATDRKAWEARGATFVAKVKATKAVWFPPGPVDTGTKAASTAKKATRKTAKKTTGKATAAAKKSSGGTKKATGAAKKTASATRKKS